MNNVLFDGTLLEKESFNLKYRTSFVTNSSSSSYICEICNEIFDGYDLTMQEVGLVCCENGHVMCAEHVKRLDSYEEYFSFSNYVNIFDDYEVCKKILKKGKEFFDSRKIDADKLGFPITTFLYQLDNPTKDALFKNTIKYHTAFMFLILRRGNFNTWENPSIEKSLQEYSIVSTNILSIDVDEDKPFQKLLSDFDFEDVDGIIPEECCPICNLSHISSNTMEKLLLNKLHITREDFAKVIRETYENLNEIREDLSTTAEGDNLKINK